MISTGGPSSLYQGAVHVRRGSVHRSVPGLLDADYYRAPRLCALPTPAGFRPALAIVVPGAGLSFMFYKGALRMLTWAAVGLPGSAPTAKYPLERLVAG
jgi:hypothetical protein